MSLVIFIGGLVLCGAYRLDHQMEAKKLMIDTSSQGSAPRCQYSATPTAVESGRPHFDSLVAVCPSNDLTKKCQQESLKSSDRSVVVPASSVSFADCESYCNQNFGMSSRGLKNPICRGYVVRVPWNDGVEKGKAQCWLIHGDAKNSSSYPTEVKIDRHSLLDNRNNKITYHKEFCGCEARIIHFNRPAFRTELALKRHQVVLLKKEVNATNGEDVDKKLALGNVRARVKELELQEADYARLNSMEGVYDWLPIRVPHRIAKKEERLLPGVFARWAKPGLIKNQAGSWKNYWQAPVRYSKIFKKSDLSAFLYLCLNKTSREENWHVANRDDFIKWASKTFRHLQNQSEEDVSEKLQDETFLQKAFFRIPCVGTKIGRDNMFEYEVTRQDQTRKISEKVDVTFWRGSDLPEDSTVAMPLHPYGCYRNAKEAQDAVEEKVLEEVGKCPVEELATQRPPEEEEKIGFLSLWRSKDQSVLGGFKKAQFLVDKLKASTRVTKWISRGYSWWTGSGQDENVKQLHHYSNEEVEAMLERTGVLLQGFSKLFVVLDAASNTEDKEIKSVCAKEVLDQIFDVGGLMPKVSQNLAMRPDLVPDDFVRNKLKETQNANPSRDRDATMTYMAKHQPALNLPGITETPLLDLLEYKQALSAGSVGQVDLFTIRADADPKTKAAFKALLPAGHGDTVIVKTVFEETESAYMNDWNLLEFFFTNCGDSCDAKMRVMWKILEPMKKSIFDEFNLTDEADFTARGRNMLEEFTRNIDAGEYRGVLEPGSIKLTTPSAIATSSKYILIQSLASGTPLKNFLEDNGGQIEHLVDWKSRVYAAILMVYGHMVVKHGFFQSDPHNGNWFWNPETKTVTLIDWGGVGQLDQDTHCKLANLYSHLGQLTKAWNDCESVELQGQDEVAGVYRRAGFSIYQAGENETALFYGRTYGVSYLNEKSGQRLFYNDEGKWKVVREHPGKQELTETTAELETKVTNMMDLSQLGPEKWSFMAKGKVSKKREVRVKKKDPASCKLPSRSEAYSIAAHKMGLGLNFACEPEDTVVIPEAPLSEDEDALSKWEDTGKRQLSCITKTDQETFLEWGLYAKLKLMIETKDGKRTVTLPDNQTYDLETGMAIEGGSAGSTVAEPADWILDAFNEESREKIANLSSTKSKMLLNAAQAQLAVATSLYDSDILTAAVLGLKAKGSVGLVTPDVPDEYVLLARCIVVFHGMLGDVLKDNFVKFVVTGQQDYIQWLVRSGGDRFFRSWLKPAEEFAEHGKCPVQEWKDLDLPAR